MNCESKQLIKQTPWSEYLPASDEGFGVIRYQYRIITQILKEKGGGKILEISKGAGVLDFLIKNTLRTSSLISEHYSLDIDPELKPDVLSDISKDTVFKDVDNKKFDIITAFEVLEHLDHWDSFISATKNIHTLLKHDGVFLLSLPHKGLSFSIMLRINVLRKYGYVFSLPYFLNLMRHKIKPISLHSGHFFEIDSPGYPRKKIENALLETGFEFISKKRLFLMPYTQFYVLRKK
jgi:SAM-dependent methyltransferase